MEIMIQSITTKVIIVAYSISITLSSDSRIGFLFEQRVTVPL